MTHQMNTDQLDDIFALDSRERYEHFFSDVQDVESLWILEDEEENILVVHPNEDISFLPVWPHHEYAQSFSQYEDKTYKPLQIGIDKFIDAWLPVLSEDDIKVGVLPNLKTTVWVIEPLELKSELEDALGDARGHEKLN